MQFGISIPNYGSAVSPDRLSQWGAGSQRLGFDLAMVTDHLAQPADVRRAYPEDFYECFAALTYLAGVTSTIRLGTSVTVLPLRHPVHTARAIATIDQLSRGRVVFGIGVGGNEQEYSALGIEYRRRGAMTDEYLEVLSKLWNGGHVSFTGKFVEFDDLLATPAPYQAGGPPIWVGGSAKVAVPRAIANNGVWHPVFPTLEILDAGARLAATLADAAGVSAPRIAPRIRLSISATALPEDDRPLGVGSVEQIATDLHTLADRHIETVVFDPVHHPFFPDAPSSRTSTRNAREWEDIELLAAEIIDTGGHRVRG
ncbi:TIGR03619 family F420-dependent LLM class oxidoreductase [Antrihabitans sp. YC3-6]|uniref:TIGR03619 family F420-dependent LLM class oxidoreductase n=1 Tax=Antrihabitans stalagmiti TaxID=2799499 RepID=A0A934NVH3_9NOCA|nr:TIGR03619 family F420-dependent LLM class oxidoreductase [Antrihabitans stalagmiti]MBJ8342038.1 TIGR03619 family F420-dependent LLM class oxidoreductase [Antrihabitans stalagmiti]